MATTLEDVCKHLRALDYRFDRDEEELFGSGDAYFGVETRYYTDPDGEKSLRVVVRLEEGGEYVKFFSPMAMKAEGPHVGALLKACTMLQWTMKLVQFEYDDSDGEIRPIIEFPIEDGTLTQTQVRRCVRGLVQIVDCFYDSLKRALDTGVIELKDASDDDQGGPPEDALAEKVRRATPDQRRRILALLDGTGSAPTEI